MRTPIKAAVNWGDDMGRRSLSARIGHWTGDEVRTIIMPKSGRGVRMPGGPR